jgi:hypothetical protein
LEIGLGLGLHIPNPHPNQVVKTLVLARITPKSFRLLPGVSQQEAAAVLKDPSLTGSNVYSPSEALVRYVSPASPLYLPCISPVSPLYLTRPPRRWCRAGSPTLTRTRTLNPNPNPNPNPT